MNDICHHQSFTVSLTSLSSISYHPFVIMIINCHHNHHNQSLTSLSICPRSILLLTAPVSTPNIPFHVLEAQAKTRNYIKEKTVSFSCYIDQLWLWTPNTNLHIPLQLFTDVYFHISTKYFCPLNEFFQPVFLKR